MEYKNSYRFMVFGQIVFVLSALDIVSATGIIIMIVLCLIRNEEGIIAGIIFISIILLFSVWLTLEMALNVVIDKNKIVLKSYRGTIVKFALDEISLIEVKRAFKGDDYVEIYGNSKDFCFKKTLMCRKEVVAFPANEKRMEILKHFVPETVQWDIKT